MQQGTRASSPFIGVAGRCVTDEEKSFVKQAVFLLRYRLRVTPAVDDSV